MDANLITYSYQALTAMRKYQVVCPSTDEMSCKLVNWPDQIDLSNIIGITMHDAIPGEAINICLFGILYDTSWDWESFKPIYVGDGGYLTQIMPPRSIYKVAKALGPNTIYVAPSQLFLLTPP